jgi:tRNA-splicing ligase RtcB
MKKLRLAKGAEEVAARAWLVDPCSHEVTKSLERLARAADVQRIAVMPDVHLSKEVCVGVALATTTLIYPAAVGADIGCGMLALPFDAEASLLEDEARAMWLLDALRAAVPSLKHSGATRTDAMPETLRKLTLSDPALQRLAERDGLWQLGTLGRGNHFLEFQADDEGRLWLLIHSGSRGMGQAITGHHVHRAGDAPRGSRLVALDASTADGQAYLADVEWAIAYAEANRIAMARCVEELLQSQWRIVPDPTLRIHAHHNHVRREEHCGQRYWVHRKGASAAHEGEAGVIGGTMGTPSFHVTGRGCEDALASSSHGAGRVLPRGEASRTISDRQTTKELRGVWYDARNVARYRDEAPSAYRDIRAVMRAQRDLVRIVRQVTPLLCYRGD